MKRLIITLTLIAVSAVLFAQTKLTEAGEKALNSFLDFRVELTEYQFNKQEALIKLEEYKAANSWDNLEEQDKLVLDNFYEMEVYNYFWDVKSYDNRFQTNFLELIDRNEDFINKHEGNVSDWLYIVAGDCYSCYMSYNPVSGALKYGLKLKKLYEKSLEINPDNSYGYSRLGQWFYWAPVVNGGGKKKTLTAFKQGLDHAKTPSDKFYAEIFYSQILYDLNDKDAAKEHLTEAKKIYPKSGYVQHLFDCNEKGYSLFTYNKKKTEDEKGIKTN